LSIDTINYCGRISKIQERYYPIFEKQELALNKELKTIQQRLAKEITRVGPDSDF